jgi:hypothetical protein
MEEMLITYQDALHALSEMQNTLDVVDSDDIEPEAFSILIENYKESRELFLSFLAEYIEKVFEISLDAPKPADVLAVAQKEKIITGKEYKHLSAHLSTKTLDHVPETEEDALALIETYNILHDTMRDILEGIEL